MGVSELIVVSQTSQRAVSHSFGGFDACWGRIQARVQDLPNAEAERSEDRASFFVAFARNLSANQIEGTTVHCSRRTLALGFLPKVSRRLYNILDSLRCTWLSNPTAYQKYYSTAILGLPKNPS